MTLTNKERKNAEDLLCKIKSADTALELLLLTGKAIEINENSFTDDSLENITLEGSELSYQDADYLIKKAREGRDHSYAPYSNFNVGAAILAQNICGEEKIFNGCNVSNAAFGSTICAERTTAFKAVSEGYRKFLACAIVGNFDYSISEDLRDITGNEYIPACGSCRQVLNEFRDDPFFLLFAKDKEDVLVTTLEFFLPCGFGPKSLGVDASSYDRYNTK